MSIVAARRLEPGPLTPPRRMRASGRVALAAGAAVVTSAAWYTVFAEPYATLAGDGAAAGLSPAVTMAVELGRSVLVSAIIALLMDRLGVRRAREALGVAALAWAAFPATLMVGSVVHDGVPVALAAIHAGDWLVKLLVVAMIVVTLQHRGGGQR